MTFTSLKIKLSDSQILHNLTFSDPKLKKQVVYLVWTRTIEWRDKKLPVCMANIYDIISELALKSLKEDQFNANFQ